MLIVDEAHSYDPYMQRQLEALLRMQARLGGSAILMTATLPLAMRQAYVEAFREGLAPGAESLLANQYPGLHLVGCGVRGHAVAPLAESIRRISAVRLSGTDDAIGSLTAAAAAGAACVWVRNAVDDAIEAAAALRRRGVNVDLLHARFASADRLRHEQTLMRRFGKYREDGAGRILVATQVIEASLDLDFDVMVSDLAPIGSLIQRGGPPVAAYGVPSRVLSAGLQPHPARGFTGPEQRGGRTTGSVTFSAVGLGCTALDEQWLTARALFDAGEIAAPGGLRTLIEAVHGEDLPPVPEALLDAQTRADGQARAETGWPRPTW